MKLLTLLKPLPTHTLTGSPQVKISHLECDSRRVLSGACYVALKGTQTDGHEFIPEAIRRGACAIVAESPCTQEARDKGIAWVEVNDSRLAVSLMGAAWNGNPSRHMAMIGVTGTNGKTTTAYIVHALLKQHWLRAGLIGTIAYDNGAEIIPSTHTTPGPLELQHLLKDMYDNGCRGVAMEVSSHALDQERVAGLHFNVGIFTNLTQDHLDYHHTMENYFQAKVKLFEQMAKDTAPRRKPVAVINIDDAYGRRLADMFSSRMTVKTYGSALGADFRMLVHHASSKGSEYELEYKGKSYLVRVPLIGKFNMYNSLAALAAVISAGIPVRDAVTGLQNIPQVPGRLELFTHPVGAQIFIDYAHTPDALENACKTLRELCSRRLITVFGCGGDRDKGKRPLMGAIAARLSDACFVTSDNPRSEEPLSIINQIAAGMPQGRYAIIPDRARAIATAMDESRLGDIILIAGKGHENYQELSTGRIAYSDAREVRRNLRVKERDDFPQA